jgi:hypothetical protein
LRAERLDGRDLDPAILGHLRKGGPEHRECKIGERSCRREELAIYRVRL